MGRPVTTSPDSERAYALEQEIVAGCRAIRTAWVGVAVSLYKFHEARMWEALGHETFEEWLGSPEVSLGRRHVFGLIQAHRELVVERDVPPAALEGIEVAKVQEILPALRRGEVDVEDALADCESLSRSDLREKYHSDGSARYRTCECCGQRVQLKEAA